MGFEKLKKKQDGKAWFLVGSLRSDSSRTEYEDHWEQLLLLLIAECAQSNRHRHKVTAGGPSNASIGCVLLGLRKIKVETGCESPGFSRASPPCSLRTEYEDHWEQLLLLLIAQLSFLFFW